MRTRTPRRPIWITSRTLERTERAGGFLDLDGPWPSTALPGARVSINMARIVAGPTLADSSGWSVVRSIRCRLRPKREVAPDGVRARCHSSVSQSAMALRERDRSAKRWREDAGHRSPSPRSNALQAIPSAPFVHQCRARVPRSWRAGPERDRWVPPAQAGRRAALARPVAGTPARRRAVGRLDSPLRARRGDAADRAARDSRASSGRRPPNDGRDAPRRTVIRSPGSGSRDPGAGVLAATPAGSSGCGRRLRPHARPRRAA